jgi:poly-gamma-glutamate synthesis protein (capsule biosynthesis protein)
VYESESGDLSIALTGDALIHRALSMFREPDFLAIRDILRTADVAVTNIETMFHDYESAPSYAPGGIAMQAQATVIDELRWLGFNLFATANNHGFDYGEAGLLVHLDHLARRGVAHAGIGRTLGQAREPSYLDTPAGRVALVAASTSGPPAQRAQHQWRDGSGRPGVNMLRYTSNYVVDEPTYLALRTLREQFSLYPPRGAEYGDHSYGLSARPDTDTSFTMTDLHNRFQYPMPNGYRVTLGDRFECVLEAVPSDVEENLQRIADARRMADWVVASLHSHEVGARPVLPSGLTVDFAHAAIDAGADVFYGNGPNQVRGVEVYRGKPIIYGPGTFIHQSATVERVQQENFLRARLDPWTSTPADFHDSQVGREHLGEALGRWTGPEAWQAVIVVVNFHSGALREITAHPLELGHGTGRAQRGRPMLARGAAAAAGLAEFQRICLAHGTEVEIDGDRGRIRLKG